MIDIENGDVVDVLPDRTAETFTAWLEQHPGAEIVCRDRASAYAEAVRTAAPDAVQIADRFHLWQNLCKAVEKCVVAHRGCLTSLDDDQDEPAELPAEPPVIEGKRAANTRRNYAAVHEMYDKGAAIQVIAETLRMDRKTVRRYAHTATVGEVLSPPPRRHSTMQSWAEYLNMRWQEGCTDSGRLFREIQERGYRGSRSVRRWLEPLRSAESPTPKRSEAPTVRQVTGWLTRHPDNLGSGQQLRLKRVVTCCPGIGVLGGELRGAGRLDAAIDAVERLSDRGRSPAARRPAVGRTDPLIRSSISTVSFLRFTRGLVL